MATRVIESRSPSVREAAEALLSATGKYVEFEYEPIPEARKSYSPNTMYVQPLERHKGFVNRVWIAGTGRWIVNFLDMNRRVLDGMGKGEYRWRSFCLKGIDLSTVMVPRGRSGKVRIFPNVQPRTRIEA